MRFIADRDALYHSPMEPVTAFILAGGKSSRMGADKAFLLVEGQTLLERALETAWAVAKDVRVVGPARKFASFALVVEDVYPGRGPLGGIHAALLSTATQFNLILAVDVPFVQPEFLRYLIAEAAASEAPVTLCENGGRLHPLSAIYRSSFAQVAGRSLEAGRNKIDTLFSEAGARIISETEMSRAGFSPHLLDNVNTPAELEAARESAEALTMSESQNTRQSYKAGLSKI
ncbi:MAG: molybdenum cofactor guanylyltransferase [Acidobacteriales bacterium]|nr:molybdenum cofactor guanylyltransferase [Terriglobales bacterium]